MADFIVPDSFATIAAAITAAEAAGPVAVQRVRIKAGTFTENLLLSVIAWTATNFLSIESFSGSKDVTVDGSGGATTLDCNNRPNIQVKNIHLKDGTSRQLRRPGVGSLIDNVETSGGSVGFENVNNNLLRLIDCEFHNHINGASLSNADGLLFERCSFHDNTSNGVSGSTNGSVQFFACLFYSNGAHGFTNTNTVRTGLFEFIQCNFFGNTNSGIFFQNPGGKRLRLLNCIFRSQGDYAIETDEVIAASTQFPIIRSDGNCYSNNTMGIFFDGTTAVTTLAAMKTLTGDDANSSDTDPLFTNETAGSEDFHLQAGSPRINGGVGAGVRTDFFGTVYLDPHHPATGPDATLDVELDAAPPAGPPIIDSLALDQTTGAVTIEWTPVTVGDTGFLYRRKVGFGQQWGSPVSSATGDLTDTVTVPALYEWIIVEEDSLANALQPPSHPIRGAFTAGAFDPLEDIEDRLSDTDAWRDWVTDGAGGPADKTQALAAIHKANFAPTGAFVFPAAVITYDSVPASEAIAQGARVQTSTVRILFLDAVDAAVAAPEKEAEAQEAFMDNVIGVIGDLGDLAEDAPYRRITDINPDGEPTRTDPNEAQGLDLYELEVLIELGI